MSGPGPVVLAINPGSSSLKAAVRDPGLVFEHNVDRLDDLHHALGELATLLSDRGVHPGAVVHRVVQGGPRHVRTSLVDDELLTDLRASVPLAPLHLPADVESIETARHLWPDATHVACFDTAFHADLPEMSRRLPIAAELAGRGVHRYGFHGLSVQSVLRARPDLGQAVVAHLGSGCSVTAVADGHSRHTTMSLTPTGGMMSATRTGDIDPEIVLYLLEVCGYTVAELRQLLDRKSGLAGLADGRRDLRDLLARPDEPARLAVDVFVRQAAVAVAACAMALDRFDTLVFTGGVGEHSVEIRRRVCADLLRLRGTTAEPDEDPTESLAGSGVRVLVVPADEQVVMDDEARALLSRH